MAGLYDIGAGLSAPASGAYGINPPSLKAYEPSWTDKLARALQWAGLPDQTVEGLTGSRGIGRTNRNLGMGLFDFTPIGIPLAVNEGQRAAEAGDWTGATLNAMAMIPGAKAGQKAIEAGVNEVKQGIRVYHGSPHDFDRFDMSKIGTGEGAQAYGHGLYFAENEGVAKQYRDNLSTYKLIQDYNNANPANRPGQVAQWWTSGMDIPKIDEALKVLEPQSTQAMRDEWIRQGQKLHDDISSQGRTYEVSINAHPDEFLDWDKPLSEQSAAVKNALRSVRSDNRAGEWAFSDKALNGELGNIPASQILGSLMQEGGLDQAGLSQWLKGGIKGIRYKDAGSRGDKSGGTHNYVVFDDKIIDILRKYGIAGLTAGGIGGAALMGQPGQAQAGDGLYGLQ